MKYLIAIFPACAVTAALVVFTIARGPLDHLYFVENVVVKVLAAAGCFAGAAQFDRGDYMRRAWAFLGSCYVLLAVNTLAFGAISHAPGAAVPASVAFARSGVVIVANVATIIGTLHVAQAWRIAGLQLPGHTVTKIAVGVGTVAIALALAGPAALADAQAALHDPARIANAASDIGDMVTLGVLAPVLLTAVALRGGLLAWPWAMLVVGTLGWLVNDASGILGAWLHLDAAGVHLVEEAARVLGCSAFFSAGLLQRASTLAAREAAAAPIAA